MTENWKKCLNSKGVSEDLPDIYQIHFMAGHILI